MPKDQEAESEIRRKDMQKQTVIEKKETGANNETDSANQENAQNILTPSPASNGKSDSVHIGVIGSETTEKSNEENNKMNSLSGISQDRMFDEYLFEAIDEVLSSLGEPVKNTLYFQLENSFNMPKNEIPKQIEEFTNIIHKIFGLGASRLEVKVMKNLNAKINAKSEVAECDWVQSKWIVDDVSFTDCVHSLRENYLNEQ